MIKKKIKGFLLGSLNEWKGHIASIIVLEDCNLRCPMCHGWKLVLQPNQSPIIPWTHIKETIQAKIVNTQWIDGVVISGGEPTIQPDLPELLKELIEYGLSTKIETNGTKPQMLRRLLKENLVNCVALDLKAPLTSEKLRQACQSEIDPRVLIESFNLLGFFPEREVRTTVCPGILALNDIAQMAQTIYALPATIPWIIQQYHPNDVMDIEVAGTKQYTENEIKETIQPFVNGRQVEYRGF